EECLTDTWTLDLDSWAASAGPAFTASGGELVSMDGTLLFVVKPDGTFDTVYESWTLNTATSEGTATIVRHGTDTGTWGVDGNQMTIADTAANSTVTVTSQAGGEEFSMEVDGAQGPLETFAFTC